MGLELYLLSSGVLLFSALNSLFLFMARAQSLKHIYLAGAALVSCFYQYFTYHYYLSNDLLVMATYLKWQVACAFAVLPIFFLFVNEYLKQATNKKWLFAISVYACLLIAINFSQPYGIRFSEDGIYVKTFNALGGSITMIHGEPAGFGLIMHLFSIMYVSWVFWLSVQLIKQHKLQEVVMFGCMTGVMFMASIWSVLIDTGTVDGVYLIGFVLTLTVLVLSFSVHLHFKRERLALQKSQRELSSEIAAKEHFLNAHSFIDNVLKYSPQPMLIVDTSGNVLRANNAACRLWGEEIISANLFPKLELIKEGITKSISCLSQQESIQLEDIRSNSIHKLSSDSDKNMEWFSANIYPVDDHNASTKTQIIIAFNDISKQMKIQTNLQEATVSISGLSGSEFYRSLVIKLCQLFESKYAFIGLLNEEGTAVTTKSVAMDGIIVDNITYDLLHTPCANVVGNETCFYSKGIQALFPKDFLLQEMGVESYIGSPITDESGKSIGLLVILHDKPIVVDKPTRSLLEILAARTGAELNRDVALASVRKMAYEDYLTGLPNRAHAYEYIQSILPKLKETQTKATLYLIDLDHFKTINDALGHDVGDEALKQFGQMLLSELPDDLFIARIGGDEFLIVDEGDESAAMTTQLLDTVNAPLQVNDHVVDLNSSIGVAIVPMADESLLDILRFAELALYQAKKNGRNTYYLYQKELEKNAVERLRVQSSLKSAISDNQLQLFYQPQVSSQGEVYGAEALVRWETEDGFVSPAYFVQLAEETGLIHHLGNWVLESALSNIKQLREVLPEYSGHISINISAWQFSLPNFVDYVRASMEVFDIPASFVMLELTETALLSDVEDAIRKLNELREMGIRIALDDFGTGYSSLAYLRELPIDELKIDKAFIDEVASENRSPLTESMISIGNSMNLDVVAEGVEHKAQVDALEAMGCSIYQGYYYARPMPFEDFVYYLKNK
jgi:diguanylate cyclase (GGDEF)-like protein